MTIAQRINAERIVVLGWGRAILLQMAHPLIAAGVYEHSGFRATPLAAVARLRHTVSAMLALSFGADLERQRALEGIRRIHRRVNGQLPHAAGPFPAGARYSAEDPELVLWVHVTLLDSVMMAYEQLVAPLTGRDRDRYCEEVAWLAIDLGAREPEVPRDWASAVRQRDAIFSSGRLVVTAEAREIAQALLAPRFATVVAPLTRANRALSVGWLPPAIRQQFGFTWTPRDQRALARTLTWTARLRRITPDAIALWPDARRHDREVGNEAIAGRHAG